MIRGRDYPFAEKLFELTRNTDISENVFMLNGIYSPSETKAIIGQFDMLVSGRIHAAVAALSQSIPTVIIDYGHEPKAHKLKGFAGVAGVEEFVSDPVSYEDMVFRVDSCWNKRVELKSFLNSRIKQVKKQAVQNFKLLKSLN